VPVGTLGGAHVMSQPGTDAPRPECAADVDVESRLEPQVASRPTRITASFAEDRRRAYVPGRDSKSVGDHRPSLCLTV
jgi:hypothetical protein